MENQSNAKLCKRVSEMARSLLDEEYRVQTKVTLATSYFIKLRHRFNGNQITIIGDKRSGLIRLLRNGKERHRETVCG